MNSSLSTLAKLGAVLAACLACFAWLRPAAVAPLLQQLQQLQLRRPAAAAGALSAAQLDQFHRDGFLVVPNFVPQAQVDQLELRMSQLLGGLDLTGPDSLRSVFTTDSEHQERDSYFLDSGDKIRFFWEEDAYTESGELKQAAELSINKVGHALHVLDDVFRGFVQQYFPGVVASLGFRRPAPLQSMYIFKQPRIGGKVEPHRDSVFVYTDPQTCVGLWVAIHPATLENGCLYAVPGSHLGPDGRTLVVEKRFVRNEHNNGTKFIRNEARAAREATGQHEGEDEEEETAAALLGEPLSIEGAVALPAEPGTLVILHGSVVHFSSSNRSQKPRHAFSLHVVETDGAVYPESNWLQVEKGHVPRFAGFAPIAAGQGSPQS